MTDKWTEFAKKIKIWAEKNPFEVQNQTQQWSDENNDWINSDNSLNPKSVPVYTIGDMLQSEAWGIGLIFEIRYNQAKSIIPKFEESVVEEQILEKEGWQYKCHFVSKFPEPQWMWEKTIKELISNDSMILTRTKQNA